MGLQIDFIANLNLKSEVCDLSFWEQIKEDWIAHGRDWTKPGFRAVANHRFGTWLRNIKPKWAQIPFRILNGMLYRKIRNSYGIELPSTVQLGRRVVILHQGAIVIHAHSTIGDDCIIRQEVTLGMRHSNCSNEAPRLGKGVDVGAGAKILGNITIGDNAKIGANAVVLCNVPTEATAVGVPAKVILSSK